VLLVRSWEDTLISRHPTMETRSQGIWSPTILPYYCWTSVWDAAESKCKAKSPLSRLRWIHCAICTFILLLLLWTSQAFIHICLKCQVILKLIEKKPDISILYIFFFICCFFTIYSRYLKRVTIKRNGCEYLKQVPFSDGSLELIQWAPLATFCWVFFLFQVDSTGLLLTL
jgi:hypothetical protein